MYYDPYHLDNQPQADSGQTEYTQPQAPKKKKRFWPKAVALILVCALVGGSAGVGGAALYGTLSGTSTNTTTLYESDRAPTVVNVSHTNTGEKLTTEEIYASWVNSTVGITTQITTNVYGQQVSGATAGSGFVISSDGYIVTNYHVIDGATSVSVSFSDGTEYDAVVVGGEESNDVAVLKIEATGLTPVIIGNSDDILVGEMVTAIGNPLGELTFSQTAGIVSAVDRLITMSDGTKMNMIQTDCTINSGNSGGPLFNAYGEVIGITSAKYSNNGSSSEASIEGIGFAIPINDVIGLIQDIIEYGYVTGKPYMGVSVTTVSEADATRYNWVVGAYVNSVTEGSPADQAGLQQGDIITALDGQEITAHSELVALNNTHKAGDTVTLTIFRAGQTMELTLTYGEQTPENMSATQEQTQQQEEQQTPSFSWPFGSFGW